MKKEDCPACQGTGEGIAGMGCSLCKGKGVIKTGEDSFDYDDIDISEGSFLYGNRRYAASERFLR
jgi:DnaJ-class molecular chaperone